MENIKKQIKESIEVKNLILNDDSQIRIIKDAADICTDCLRKGNKILLAGNGGSAADAQHIAGELVNKFGFDRPGLAALALTTDSSVMTSISNDYGFNHIFSRQVEALGREGDVLIAISTSGNSVNILEAIKMAAEKGMKVIGFTGKDGGKMKELCDIVFRVPSDQTPRIQEAHMVAGHIICHIIETSLFSKS